jgi:nucleotide-binding universal stress UspA family protein
MFKDIVVGITKSGIDECAVDAAIEFTKRFESKLFLIHVAGMEQGWGEMEQLEGSGETSRIKARLEERYASKLEGVDNYRFLVLPGMPHAELLRYSRKMNSDLIVLGPHTKEYSERRSKMWGMAGSTLERVSQRARCPVMIVSMPGRIEEHKFLNIVAATDFSDPAECAVNYGGQMARHYKSKLTVFHCLSGGMTEDEAVQRLKEEYEPRVKGIENVDFQVRAGTPSMEILKLAREKEADLIIMAHHSKETDPEKAFLGSTVTQVALNSVCPTMSVNKHFDLRCGMMYDQTGAVAEETAAAE